MIRKIKDVFSKRINRNRASIQSVDSYEYCPRCNASLSLQKGYDNSSPYWICKGCGEMLINPAIDSDVAWICDKCGAMLNIQPEFSEDCGEWTCTECGFVNRISDSELYTSEDEYQAEQHNPYKGLSDEDFLKLSCYEDGWVLEGKPNIMLVRDPDTRNIFVKKCLTTYNKSVYEYLLTHPIKHMPKIKELYESSTCLIVIEEFIEGDTIADHIGQCLLSQDKAVRITKSVCEILNELHNLETPIIHRDIKPSNIILTEDDEVYLLDMNVAKWYDANQTDDTNYMGTQYFAAPEQVGYGLSASSAKSDIYAVGMLLNVMLTGEFPKQKRAAGKIWPVIERCISLEASKRYTAAELIEALDGLEE